MTIIYSVFIPVHRKWGEGFMLEQCPADRLYQLISWRYLISHLVDFVQRIRMGSQYASLVLCVLATFITVLWAILTLVLLHCFNGIFRHLKLQLLTQFPSPYDEKYLYIFSKYTSSNLSYLIT